MFDRKHLAAAVCSFALVTGSVQAGGVAEPLMEPEVIAEESSDSGGFLIPLLFLALLAAAISSSGGGGEVF